MDKNTIKIIGVLSLVVGLILAVNAYSGLTGFVLFDGMRAQISYFVGALFLVWGMFLLLIERGEEE